MSKKRPPTLRLRSGQVFTMACGPNEVWLNDPTDIPTDESWLYIDGSKSFTTAGGARPDQAICRPRPLPNSSVGAGGRLNLWRPLLPTDLTDAYMKSSYTNWRVSFSPLAQARIKSGSIFCIVHTVLASRYRNGSCKQGHPIWV